MSRFMVHTHGGSVFYICTKFQADSSFPSKVIRGSQNFDIGQVTRSHAPIEPKTFNLCRNPPNHTRCQILFLYLDPLLSYG